MGGGGGEGEGQGKGEGRGKGDGRGEGEGRGEGAERGVEGAWARGGRRGAELGGRLEAGGRLFLVHDLVTHAWRWVGKEGTRAHKTGLRSTRPTIGTPVVKLVVA